MKKILITILAVIMVLGITACGGSDEENNPADVPAEQNQVDVITLEELYGVYVSSADESVSFEFTPEEITLDENNIFLTSHVYMCPDGKDKRPVGAYALEIEGNLLTVVDWHGGEVPFEIAKEGENITLKFLADQFEFSSLESPDVNVFLSDLTKLQ